MGQHGSELTTREPRRTLTAHMSAWDADRVTRLLVRRPDLGRPRPPSDLAELAQRAQQYASVVAAVSSTTLPENRLLQLVVCCRPDLRMGELAAALPEGVSPADVEHVLQALEEAALVWRHDGRVHASGTLRQAMPTALGPPAHVLLGDQTVDYLKSAIKLLRSAAISPTLTLSLPPPSSGPDERPPRKPELIEELTSLLAAPGLVDAVLATGPDAVDTLSRAMADDRPVIPVHHPMYYSRHSSFHTREPTYWLFERALLLPMADGRSAAQPREVGVALRGGRPVPDLALQKPVLVTGDADQVAVDAAGAARAVRTIERLTDLLEAWAGSPVTALKGGGLRVADLKRIAAPLDDDVTEAARLVELANLAGMLESGIVHKGRGRNATYETVVTATAAAAAWSARPLPERWAQLVGAWMRAEHWPSATGRKEPGTKTTPVLKYQYAPGAHERRRAVLHALASMAPGQATTPASLAAAVYWEGPQSWRRVDVERPATVVRWVYEEAELLGMADSGSLSTFGRLSVDGDPSAAGRALTGALPEPVRSFTLQADLTAMAVGALDRDVLVELRLLADQESSGAATTFRFSYSSLRRGLDAGRDADGILAFLEDHADKGVPGPLAYLVADVARRHGHLQVGGAGAFVVGDDPAVLADACSHRQTRKLGLRLLSPTVAVSPAAPAKVIEGLREAGFLPTAHAGEPGTVSVAAASSARPPRRGEVTAIASGDLPEPFLPRTGLRTAPAAPIDEESAANLAAAIVAGPPPAAAAVVAVVGPALRLVPDPSPFEDPRDHALENVLESAFREGRVLAVSLGDPDGELAEPIVMLVTDWEPGRVVGTDLEDGHTTVILSEHIGAVLDLGPISEIDLDEFVVPSPDPPPRRPPARRPPPRRRRR